MQPQFIHGSMQVDNKIKKVKEFISEQKDAVSALEESGLLIELDTVDATQLAAKLEELRKIILSSVFIFDARVEYLIFPIVTRAFREYKHLIIDCLRTLNYVNSNIHAIPKVWDYGNIDIEAAFCNLMAEEIARLKL